VKLRTTDAGAKNDQGLVELKQAIGEGNMDVVITDIVFDAAVDPKLFSLDPPEGYTDLAAKKPEEADKSKSK
jgi:hypothetical protein